MVDPEKSQTDGAAFEHEVADLFGIGSEPDAEEPAADGDGGEKEEEDNG